jgi:hypothetical protein
MVVLKSPANRRPRMANMAYALDRIKTNPLQALDRQTIERVCRECKHEWRERDLDPATTVALFCQQIAFGNLSCSELRRAARGSFSLQAYCAARARLPLGVVQGLLSAVVDAALPQARRAEHLWHGHRTFHVDGSSFSMPDTKALRDAFGTPSGQAQGCAFPTAHLLVLFSASTGLLIDAFAGPLNTGDVAQTPELHLHLDAGDVVIGDDTFSGYAHLALLVKQGLHGLFPVHHRRIVDFTKGRPHAAEGARGAAAAGTPTSRWVESLGREDQLVEYFKPKGPPAWMSQAEYDALPDSILVRELRRTVQRPGAGKVTLTLVTTLVDPQRYPAADLLDLRLRRWDVETNIGSVKTTMGMDVLRCKTEEGVRKEVAVFCLVYNLVRCVMLEAARRQDVPVARVSFADALYWVRHARPGDALPPLTVNPHRPGRAEPRCRKRRPKPFPLMKKPREELRKALKNSGKTG